ncbi:MAG TPA: FTR1 family protein [Burkholderiales bacterium]|nr:FTR1 family protein [Burkholderiales bacterium]
MLLTSVIIVLREVLEAALIVSVLLAIGRTLPVRVSWVGWAFGFGAIGALLYATNIATVSDWFNGVGQEVVNALLQIAIYIFLMLFIMRVRVDRDEGRGGDKLVSWLMIVSVSLAITREGSELLVYFSGFASDLDLFTPVLIGGVVGASIGISLGALTYYLLLNINRAWTPHIGTVVIALVGAGLASQAALLLIQADWLPSQPPLWDSSNWLPETSVTGQLLYALIGYEATPTPLQGAIYFVALLAPIALIKLLNKAGRRFLPSS